MERTSRLVREVDRDDLVPKLKKVYEAIYGEEAPEDLRVVPCVLIRIARVDLGHTWAVVNSEGVGSPTSSSGTVSVHTESGRGWYCPLPIAPEQIKTLGPRVDFAEFVRTFGARLDSNWSIWDERMKGVAQ